MVKVTLGMPCVIHGKWHNKDDQVDVDQYDKDQLSRMGALKEEVVAKPAVGPAPAK